MKSKTESKTTSTDIVNAAKSALSTPMNELTICDLPHTIKMLAVNCLPEISRHFYAGDGLLHVNETTMPDELEVCYTEQGALLPGLKATVESLMGAGNFEYCYHHIGPYHVSLHWLIKTAGAVDTIKLINSWLRYEGIDDIVSLESIDLSDAEHRLLTGA